MYPVLEYWDTGLVHTGNDALMGRSISSALEGWRGRGGGRIGWTMLCQPPVLAVGLDHPSASLGSDRAGLWECWQRGLLGLTGTEVLTLPVLAHPRTELQ